MSGQDREVGTQEEQGTERQNLGDLGGNQNLVEAEGRCVSGVSNSNASRTQADVTDGGG